MQAERIPDTRAARPAVGDDPDSATSSAADPSAADWALTAALAVGLLPIGLVELFGAVRMPGDAAWLAVVLAVVLALHLSVLIRRRAPRIGLVWASAAMLGLVLASVPGLPYDAALLPSSLVFLVHVYTAAQSDDRLAGLAAPVIGVLGAGLMLAVSVPQAPEAVPGAVVALGGFLLASVGAAWALGRYRRESRRKRHAERLGLAKAAELEAERERAALARERRRIGRELHDVVSHSLAVMVAQAEAARVMIGRDDGRARRSVEQVLDTGRGAMGDMRGLLGVLAGDDGSDAPRSPSPGLDGIPELVAGADGPGRAASLVETGEARPVSPGAALAAYRVVQESLTNALRHAAGPGRIEVRLAWGEGELAVSIADEPAGGDGGEPGAPGRPGSPGGAGRGIRGMRERVEQVGGAFEAGPAGPPGRGWLVRAVLPLDRTEEP